MRNQVQVAEIDGIEAAIHFFRGQKVLLDSDLAGIYAVSTTRLNEQFKRNRGRFPGDFAFQLTQEEFRSLISQIAISKRGRGGRRKLPWVFTEHGAIMLASVLNSPVAVEASVRVVRAFVHLREMLANNKQLAVKFGELERRLDGHDEAIKTLFDAIRELLKPEPPETPRGEIGFHVREQARKYRNSNGN
jgi:hypothetical protein